MIDSEIDCGIDSGIDSEIDSKFDSLIDSEIDREIDCEIDCATLVLVLFFVLFLPLHLLYLVLLVALVVVVVFRSPFYRSSLSAQRRWRYLCGLSPPPRPQYVRPAPGSASASGGRVHAGSQAPGPASAEEYTGSRQMRQRFAYSDNSTAG